MGASPACVQAKLGFGKRQGFARTKRCNCVGIDVCKGWLDVHLHPIGQGLRVANDPTGLKRLKRELAGTRRRHVALELDLKLLNGKRSPIALVEALGQHLAPDDRLAIGTYSTRPR